MKLIIGGVFQGKLEFARNTYKITDGWIDGRTCDPAEIVTCRGICHFHEFIRRLLHTDSQAKGKAAQQTTQNTEEVTAEETAQAIAFFDGSLKNLTALEEQAEAFADWLYQENPNLVVVSTELGYGIVPMEKDDRLWRETVGRVCTRLASNADEVVRVVCGIGIWLKNVETTDKAKASD